MNTSKQGVKISQMKLTCPVLLLACLVIAGAGCGPKPATTTPAALPTQKPAAQPEPTPAAKPAGTLRIGVPCGLAMAYKEARTLFLQEHPGVKISEHIINVGPMTREIRDGKVKMDVFLSLGEEEIATLSQAGRLQGKPTPFLRHSMQLIVQKGNPLGIKRIEDLAKPQVKTVAICIPKRTIGLAAEKALKAAGVWDKLTKQGKLVRLDQPMQTKSFVFAHKADAAFIYASCSTAEFSAADPQRSVLGKADVVLTVPESSYGGMFAIAAVTKDAPNPDLASAFVQSLLTAPAQDAMAKIGYGKVSPTP